MSKRFWGGGWVKALLGPRRECVALHLFLDLITKDSTPREGSNALPFHFITYRKKVGRYHKVSVRYSTKYLLYGEYRTAVEAIHLHVVQN